ncbi:MAG: cyclase family protein, partial [Microthrixaceae bacterium]
MAVTETDPVLSAIAGGLEVFDLGRPYTVGMPQSPNHPAYRHALDRRHGDRMRDCGGSAAADIITLGCHVGTHIDALAHVSQDGRLHGGIVADDAQRGGKFNESGIHTVDPIAGRGVLLDVPAALGNDACDERGHLRGGYEITVEDLEKTLAAQGTDLRPGDTVLVRS